jgi:hypothetical protein
MGFIPPGGLEPPYLGNPFDCLSSAAFSIRFFMLSISFLYSDKFFFKRPTSGFGAGEICGLLIGVGIGVERGRGSKICSI